MTFAVAIILSGISAFSPCLDPAICALFPKTEFDSKPLLRFAGILKQAGGGLGAEHGSSLGGNKDAKRKKSPD